MEKKLVFNKEKPKHTLILNFENPFFQISKIEIPQLIGKSILELEQFTFYNNSFSVLKTSKNGSSEEQIIISRFDTIDKEVWNGCFEKNFEINQFNDYKYDSIELSYNFDSEEHAYEIVIYYLDRDIYPMESPWGFFENHLALKGNNRILFSSQFGTGKTTFLNQFFENNSEIYEVFHLFPVNYSVANNQDIFKYIKVELLYKLLDRGVVFDKESYPKDLTFFYFAKQNIDNLLLPFTRLIPKVGGSVFDIVNNLNKLRKEFKKFHSEQQIDDSKKALEFIQECFNKEGSLFEDNFYTQLIRQLLEQIKKNGKETVLVIDDLDRIDPDHIFRILNVFSAHFDTSEYNHENLTNKFGFDKVIMVCDYVNLRKIFQHKYGYDTHFEGYIDKYFSIEKFDFDNKKVAKIIIDQISYYNAGNRSFGLDSFLIIVEDLMLNELLGLREILKLRKMNFDHYLDSQLSKEMVHVHYLSCLTDPEFVTKKFEKCSLSIDATHREYSNERYNETMFLSALSTYNRNKVRKLLQDKDSDSLTLDNVTIKFTRIDEMNRVFEIQMINLVNQTINGYELRPSDYYKILVRIVKQYISIGGIHNLNRS